MKINNYGTVCYINMFKIDIKKHFCKILFFIILIQLLEINNSVGTF